MKTPTPQHPRTVAQIELVLNTHIIAHQHFVAAYTRALARVVGADAMAEALRLELVEGRITEIGTAHIRAMAETLLDEAWRAIRPATPA